MYSLNVIRKRKEKYLTVDKTCKYLFLSYKNIASIIKESFDYSHQ